MVDPARPTPPFNPFDPRRWRYADRIIALCDGRLIHQGPPEALIRPDVLAEIHDTHIDVRQIDGRQTALHSV